MIQRQMPIRAHSGEQAVSDWLQIAKDAKKVEKIQEEINERRNAANAVIEEANKLAQEAEDKMRAAQSAETRSKDLLNEAESLAKSRMEELAEATRIRDEGLTANTKRANELVEKDRLLTEERRSFEAEKSRIERLDVETRERLAVVETKETKLAEKAKLAAQMDAL